MKARMAHVFLGSLVLFLVTTGMLYAGSATKKFKKTVSFQPGGEIMVKNVNGKIEVESWDRDAVKILADIKVKAGSRKEAEDFLEEVEIVIDEGRDRLRIEPDYPKRGGGGFWDRVFGRKWPEVEVQFWITVPHRSDLDLKTVNGGVEVTDVEGSMAFETVNGGIDAEDIEGSADAKTVNGGIRVELTRVDSDADMDFHTVNGGIKIYLPGDVEADVKASTVNGGISTDFPLKVKGKFNSKSVDGEINGGGGSVRLHTVNGGIGIYEK